MLHASKTWPSTKPVLQRLPHNVRAMIRQICNVKPEDVATIRSNELLTQLEIDDLDVILRRKGLVSSDMLNALVVQSRQPAPYR